MFSIDSQNKQKNSKFCLKKRKKQQFFNNFAVFKQIFININNIIEKKYIMEEGCKDL
jgi:hypothetical protein